MRVAIAGSGDLTRYFCEEFIRAGHQVTVLTRSIKPHLQVDGVTQKVTNFISVPSILSALGVSTVLISTILDYTTAFTDVHVALLEAVKQSPHCKRFIPAEYGGNLKDHPDQPMFDFAIKEPVRKILREQHDVEWTLICCGWLMDYLVPPTNRYMKDIGPTFPVDLKSQRIIIPGTGNEKIDLTAVSDVAKAVAALLNAPSWEPYTYISGDHTTWREVSKHFPSLPVQYISLAQLVKTISTATDEETRVIAEYQLFTPSGAGGFEPERVEKHRTRFFSGQHFRSVTEFLDEARRNPETIL
jgi:putative NADH-flavin reductase